MLTKFKKSLTEKNELILASFYLEDCFMFSVPCKFLLIWIVPKRWYIKNKTFKYVFFVQICKKWQNNLRCHKTLKSFQNGLDDVGVDSVEVVLRQELVSQIEFEAGILHKRNRAMIFSRQECKSLQQMLLERKDYIAFLLNDLIEFIIQKYSNSRYFKDLWFCVHLDKWALCQRDQ